MKTFAIAALALAGFSALAAPTLVSPADYETVSSMSPFLKSFKDSAAMFNWQTYRTEGTAARLAYEKDYKYTNGFIRLEWSGTTGPATVAVTRLRDGAVVFTATTDSSSALFTDPEIGRNYSWTVTEGASSATGHFYVERNAPRIIAYKGGDGIRHLVNGRDIGGWTNTAGKVVRQGRIYRSAMTELCSMDNPKDSQDRYQPLDYVRDVLGIRLDVDLRATSDTWLGIFINDWTWTWPQGLKISPIAPGIPRFHSEDSCGACFQDYGHANAASTGPTQTAKQNRAAVWHTFTNFCQEANMPLLFHCMWGKDRTGTLGYILLGLLGVPRADLNRDWGLSWYAVSNESFVLSRWEIDDVYTFLQNYAGASLADKCESYLLKCASDAGVGAASAQALINQFKALMLEDPEPKFTPAVPGADYVPLSIDEPADYATISTMSARMKFHLANANFLTYSFFKTANTDSSPNQTRLNYFHDYATNSVPTVLSWSGAGGPYTVKLWRTHIDSAGTPVYVKETTEPEAVFFDLEVGRNYTWTVTDGISTVTGHFFTERNAPRIVYRKQDPSKAGSQGKNLRDMGGWTGANGKVVRQGLIFRSGQLEDCNASNDAGEDLEIDHLKYNLGIRLDLDFRTKAFMETWYTRPPAVEQSARWSWTHARPVIDMSNIGADIPRYNVNKETGYEFPSSVPATGSARAGARIAHWAAFTNLLAAAERPVLFHCSEGQDRTGAFGLVVLGVLGVADTDAKKDYGLSWCYNDDSAMTTSYGYKTFDNWITNMGGYNASASTLQAKCRAFLLQCAADAGDAVGAGDRIDAFIDMMLEDPETADTPPPAPNDNHTIICYGDSVTRGSGADSVTMDGRTTYFGGRLAGVAEVAESYPYWLSGMLSETYDVVNQSRGSTLAAHVSSWAGVQDVSVKSGFTLPRSGSVTLSKKFVFDDSTYGSEYGGIPGNEKLGGFVPPIYPLSENYAAGTTSDSIVGTLGGHRVRIQGASTSSLTVMALDALSADVAIAAGTKFIPESATVEQYTNAVRIICMGGNDWIELRSGDYGTVDAYTYTYNTHIRPLAMKIKAQGGRFLVVSPVFSPLGPDPEGGELDSPVANEVEALMAADFGANYLNMRLAFVQNIDRLAQKFGIAGADGWAHRPSAFRNDQVHLTSAGYRIKAALVREKLIELGYVTEVDRPEYTTTFPYDGTEKQCIAEGSGYVIGGTYKATAGGTYQAQVSPASGYTWTDGTTTPVVINWVIDVYSVKVSDVEALLQNHVYTGTALSCGLASNAKYTVGGATSRTDAGTYSVTVTLNNGYTWDDNDPASAKTFTWTIAKAANSWVSAPSVSRESWPAGSAPALTYSVGAPASGTAVNVSITKNGAAFDGTLAGMAAWAMGFYNIAFSVAESANYTALETTLQVTVLDSAPATPLDTTLFDTHPEWGYKVENLGDGGDEVALVFTNQAATASWTVSAALENVQFLVVGGGGGGGADMRTTRTYDTGCGGGGGGGGGVVTGLVNFAKNSVVSIAVGHGGSGGRNGVSTCHKMFAHYYNENQTKLYEAVSDAGEAADSSFSVGGLTYVTAYAGGGDQGGRKDKDCVSNFPEDGGSGAGARCGALDFSSGTGVKYYSVGTRGSAIDDHSLVPFYQAFGTSGGANKYSWAGGGGGGAVTSGGDTYCIDKKIASVLAGKNVTRTVRYPGAGGEGLASAITGTRRVYGSGGGGGFAVNADRADNTESHGVIYLGSGIGALGGTGAGNGNQTIGSSTVPASGTSAVANQGGGGGGGGLFGNGGSGGSGIVVFRFAVPKPEAPPAAPESVFEGHPEWGYAVPGLGADGNEVALVFTNQSATISFAAPGSYTNVAFLVVGGGGGGGGDNKNDDGSLGGGGGGGGGVVTGVVYRIAQNATVAVTVGAGGAGGKAQTKPGSSYSPNYYGGAKPGSASVLKVDGVTYVTADGGGRDQGVNGTGSSSPGTAGGPGGSSAGSRPLVTTRGVATKGSIGSGAEGLLTAVLFGEQGGAGTANVNYAAGGGGGATEEGGSPSDYHAGGKGGEGLGSDITGTLAVYGSGGGGGTAVSGGNVSSGGTGAGNGGRGGIAGAAGAANLGGGGGGGGGEKNGGAGGSGIVVLRVRIAEAPEEPELTEIAVPAAVTGLVYTGEVLTGVAAGDGYTLDGATATDAGDYTATATLAAGYLWADDSTAALEIPWSIAQAQNAWTTEPSITKATWTTEEEAGVLTPAATQFGAPSATIAKDGGAAEAFAGTALPTAAGAYVITYASSATANWLAPTPASKTVSFTIAEPAVPQPEPIEVTLFDEHPEWGYKVEGLGAAHDEMAIVFTNQGATASWTLPADLYNIEFLVVGGGGGGGSDLYSDDVRQGGGGGGGGGVVTGVVAQVAKDAVLSVTVGAGGVGGVVGTKRSNNYGAAANGANSSFSVGGVTYVTALGGGGDLGSSKLNATGNAGGAGGSSAGSRPGNAAQTAPAGTASCISSAAAANLAASGILGNAGGGGTTTAFYGYFFAAGGGGGATEAGGDATPFDGSDYDSAYWGGEGGEGLASDITGTTAVYGSGGGGGSVMSGSYGRGGHGGTGAGDGNVNSATGAGTSALPNLGGGGGGGGRGANGGRGGSGIVVLRFRVPGAAPALPQVAGEDVEPAAVFTKAREAKSIVYPSEPTITGAVGSQVISFGGVDVNVPDYYTATLSGTTVTLALNANARPVIADEDETPGIEIVDGKVRIHLSNVKDALYYTILSATSLDSDTWTPCGEAEQGQDDFEFNASGATRFYKASVRDEAE